MLKNKRLIAALVVVFTILSCGFVVKLTTDSRNKSSSVSTDASLSSIEQATDTQVLNEDEVVDIKPEIIKYVVKPGDTLEAIASSNNITVDTIAGSNGISKDSLIKEGQELRFPSIKGLIYRIKSGETLWDIASTYDVDIEEISSLNDIETPDKLKINQEIILPGVDRLKVTAKNTQETSVKSAAASSVKIASRGSVSSSSSSKTAYAAGSMWPLSGTITSRFGPRWGTTHKGIDIAAPTGTDIRAFMSGKVIFSGWEGGYGKLVIMDHGNGLQSYYGHNSKLFVNSGQYVNKGQHIADVGSTGDSTGPHCHFEIRKNGISVNPLNYLK